jgi:hypothetical protein
MRIALATILLLMPAAASAEFFDGNEVYNWCPTKDVTIYAYVAGNIDRAMIDNSAVSSMVLPEDASIEVRRRLLGVKISMALACIPQEVDLRQIGDVFCVFLEQNPAKRHAPAADLLDEALKQAWPCQ